MASPQKVFVNEESWRSAPFRGSRCYHFISCGRSNTDVTFFSNARSEASAVDMVKLLH